MLKRVDLILLPGDKVFYPEEIYNKKVCKNCKSKVYKDSGKWIIKKEEIAYVNICKDGIEYRTQTGYVFTLDELNSRFFLTRKDAQEFLTRI